MNFKIRKIKSESTEDKKFRIRKFIRSIGSRFGIIALSIFLLGGVFWSFAQISNIISSPTKGTFLQKGPLTKDENGHVNIVLLGVAGEGGEGGNLSDSIMIASFNPKIPSVSFLSLPRDLYVESEMGSRRINEVYAAAKYKHKDAQKGLDIVKKAISKFTGIDIHYGAVINFDIFEEIIDELGGIEVFVPEDITDPFYPDKDYGYQTFVIRKGLQKLDGATALKYARSRKTSSDYDRARRQQDILLAIRKKAEDIALLSNFDKLTEFYKLYQKNIATDIKIKELITLAKIGLNIDYQNAVVAVLNDDPQKQGGYLYTPAKEFYGGRYVLLPEDLKETQLFMDLVLIHPNILLENAQIEVLNGSKLPGKARETANRLKKLGFHIIEIGNYETEMPIFATFIETLTPDLKTTDILKKIFETEKVLPIPTENIPEDNLTDIKVILGTT